MPDFAEHFATLGFIVFIGVGVETVQVPEQALQLSDLGVADIVPDLKKREVGEHIYFASHNN